MAPCLLLAAFFLLLALASLFNVQSSIRSSEIARAVGVAPVKVGTPAVGIGA
jgi:hypothetical protein